MCVCDVVQVSEWQSRAPIGAAFCTLLGAEAAAPIATPFLAARFCQQSPTISHFLLMPAKNVGHAGDAQFALRQNVVNSLESCNLFHKIYVIQIPQGRINAI